MKDKELIKNKSRTVLLIIAVIIIIAITIVFIYKQNIEKNTTNKNVTKNTTLESTAQKVEETGQLAENEQKDVDKIILDELKEKRLLAKNNIDIDSKVKYVKMNSNDNPIYIVHVEHEQDEDGNRSIYFFVSYNNGQVLFDKALEHKYEYDLYYEQNAMTIKVKLAYKGYITTIYGKIKDDGEFEQLDEFIESANEENQNYILNGKEVSKKEYENIKAQYDNKQFISFSDMSKELVSGNETVQNITGQGNTNSEDEKVDNNEIKQNQVKLIQFDEIFYELKDGALEFRECENIKNYKDFEYDLDGDSKKDKITIKNIGKDDLRKRR